MRDRSGLLLLLLDATGLSQAELARIAEVTPRTVSRWLDRAYPVPNDVIERLETLRAAQARAAAESLKIVAGVRSEHGAGDRPALLVYRHDADLPPWAGLPTATAHRALLRRIYEALGGAADIVQFDGEEYRRWRGRRADAQDLRSAWAATAATRE